MRWFSLESPVVECKYFFTHFKAENYLSLTALVAGMTINNCLKVQLPLTAVHFSRKNSIFVAELKLTIGECKESFKSFRTLLNLSKK